MSKRASLEDVRVFDPKRDKRLHPIAAIAKDQEGQTVALSVDAIRPDPNQARKVFSEESIASLAVSIKEKGLFQPVSVRPDPDNEDRYILVMGERRWRAHKHAGLATIRAFVIPVDDPNEAFELALIENVQREDLNPLEEAAGIAELMKRKKYRQREAAKVVGRSESQVSRLLKLNTLPEEIREKLVTSQLSQDQLFRVAEQETPEAMLKLHDRIVKLGLSVRETRQVAKGQKTDQEHPLVAKVGRFERFLTRTDVSEVDQLEKEEKQALSAHLEALTERAAEIQKRLRRKG